MPGAKRRRGRTVKLASMVSCGYPQAPKKHLSKEVKIGRAERVSQRASGTGGYSICVTECGAFRRISGARYLGARVERKTLNAQRDTHGIVRVVQRGRASCVRRDQRRVTGPECSTANLAHVRCGGRARMGGLAWPGAVLPGL